MGVARRPAAAAQGGGDRRRQLGHGGRGAARARRARGRARHPHRGEGREIVKKGENERYLPGREAARGGDRQARERDRDRRLRPGLPRGAVEGAAERRRRASPTGSARAPRSCCSPRASFSRWARSPNDYVSERVRARAIASLGGPAHAREAAAGMAALVLASCDADLRTMLGEVFDRAGLVCERTDDVTGVEVAGAAKNAAALAAAAAERFGLNAAGIAAAGVWRECVDYALAKGAQARDLLRARRRRRPDRDRDGAEEPQPPGRRAARRRGPGGEDRGPDRPGVGGPRLGAADRRGRRPAPGSTPRASRASRR